MISGRAPPPPPLAHWWQPEGEDFRSQPQGATLRSLAGRQPGRWLKSRRRALPMRRHNNAPGHLSEHYFKTPLD